MKEYINERARLNIIIALSLAELFFALTIQHAPSPSHIGSPVITAIYKYTVITKDTYFEQNTSRSVNVTYLTSIVSRTVSIPSDYGSLQILIVIIKDTL